MPRTDFTPHSTSPQDFYRLLTAVVVPRPIAWVSTLSADGDDNLAPHSFYTVTSVDPPIIQFTSVGVKDSLRNVQARGEFVVNFAPDSLFHEVNATATDFAPNVSEFDQVGLTREASRVVAPPRVRESPVALECRLYRSIPIGDCTVVMGEVVHAAVSSEVLNGAHPLIEELAPLSRLGRDEWGTLAEVREIRRIRASEWPSHFSRTVGHEQA